MDFLRRNFGQIVKQLAVLNTSQRIAITLCAVLVAGSLFWLVNYTAAPEMVPVLPQDLTLDEVGTALTTLEGARIGAKQVGNRVYVRPRDRDRALLALNQADALPRDTSVGFSELMADDDPFRSSDENKWRRQVALGNELARIIASSDDVEAARVITQEKSRRRLGAMGNIEPTASVHIRMVRGKSVSQAMVEGLCKFVSGAVPGLEPQHVTVWDASTGRAHSIPDPEDLLGIGLLDEKKRNEEYLTTKIFAALRSIPGVLVSVSVDLDPSRTKTQTHDWAKPEVKTDESTSVSNESGNAPGETGVNPNVGVALAGGAAGTKNETEESRTDFFEVKPTKVENTEKIPFAITRATASVGIPRSFLTGIYQARFGEDADVSKLDDNDDFRTIRDAEIGRVRSKVMTILMAKSADDVDVEVFYDFATETAALDGPAAGGTPIMASAEGSVTDLLRKYGVHAGLVFLALISFITMARMVRKSTVVVKAVLPPERSAAEQEEAEELLEVAGGPVGRAAVTEGLLIGEEVDEETLRYTQVGEQVSRMVETNPETAAELLRRWAESRD